MGFLSRLRQELLSGSYRPQPVKRVYIEKANGVISPLLANLYLHWFDRQFHSVQGPYHWANARLVRYADDFVIMARYVGPGSALFNFCFLLSAFCFPGQFPSARYELNILEHPPMFTAPPPPTSAPFDFCLLFYRSPPSQSLRPSPSSALFPFLRPSLLPAPAP